MLPPERGFMEARSVVMAKRGVKTSTDLHRLTIAIGLDVIDRRLSVTRAKLVLTNISRILDIKDLLRKYGTKGK